MRDLETIREARPLAECEGDFARGALEIQKTREALESEFAKRSGVGEAVLDFAGPGFVHPADLLEPEPGAFTDREISIVTAIAVYLVGDGRSGLAMMTKARALCRHIVPHLCPQSDSEFAAAHGISKQLVSKVATNFSRRFGFVAMNARNFDEVERMRQAMRASHRQRKQKSAGPTPALNERLPKSSPEVSL